MVTPMPRGLKVPNFTFIEFISEHKSICVSQGRGRLALMVLTSADGSIPATAEANPNTDQGHLGDRLRGLEEEVTLKDKQELLMLHGKNARAEKMYYSTMNS